MNPVVARLLVFLALAQLVGCAFVRPMSESGDTGQTPWATASSHTSEMPQWQHFTLPGKKSTEFTYTRMDGRDAMSVVAISSASMLRQVVRIEPQELDSVRFSWKVPALIKDADMALREADDSPVRIVLAFEGDRSKFSPKNSMLSELSHALTGEAMSYATLMYVWCNQREPGSMVINPRTDRIRKMVVQSGPKQLNQWLDYTRNIREDYERAFGEPPGALVGIGIMTDSDNTHSTTKAWYGPVRLTTQVAAK
jgi:hypothetical protein